MGIWDRLQETKLRESVLRSALALGTFAALPYPEEKFSTLLNVILVLVWLFTALWAWSLVFSQGLSIGFWATSLLLSFLLLLKLGMYSHPLLLIAWQFWAQLRNRRLKKLNSVLFFVVTSYVTVFWEQGVVAAPKAKDTSAEQRQQKSPSSSQNAENSEKKEQAPIGPEKFESMEDLSSLSKKEKEALINTLPKPEEVARDQALERQKAEAIVELPKYLSGHKLNDYSSCLVYDQIPWRFSGTHRRTRLILKDQLRHQEEKSLKEWEIYQVLDRDGFVTYVFRTLIKPKVTESIVIKDTFYNRFIEVDGKRKQVSFQDLKTLANLAAVTFYSRDGGRISLVPGSIGKSALVIQLAKAEGRALPPVFIRGSACDRPEDEENSDQKAKENTGAAPKK